MNRIEWVTRVEGQPCVGCRGAADHRRVVLFRPDDWRYDCPTIGSLAVHSDLVLCGICLRKLQDCADQFPEANVFLDRNGVLNIIDRKFTHTPI